MPERISDELLAQSPVTHDEHARALKELVYERVLLNRRKDADAQQDAALAKLAEEEAYRVSESSPMWTPEEAIAELPPVQETKPAAKPKAKKEK